MYKNEHRQLRVTISSSENLPFTIREARYEVYWYDGHELEDEGVCDVDGRIITIEVHPEQTGLYIVKYFMTIAEEIVVRKIHISVSEL